MTGDWPSTRRLAKSRYRQMPPSGLEWSERQNTRTLNALGIAVVQSFCRCDLRAPLTNTDIEKEVNDMKKHRPVAAAKAIVGKLSWTVDGAPTWRSRGVWSVTNFNEMYKIHGGAPSPRPAESAAFNAKTPMIGSKEKKKVPILPTPRSTRRLRRRPTSTTLAILYGAWRMGPHSKRTVSGPSFRRPRTGKIVSTRRVEDTRRNY